MSPFDASDAIGASVGSVTVTSVGGVTVASVGGVTVARAVHFQTGELNI